MFRSAVPSGPPAGVHEAQELRDKDPKAWHGKGVLKAVENINKLLAPMFVGKLEIDESNQSAMDKMLLNLDGTENKSRIGANALLGVSIAICKAGAAKKGVPLYKHIAQLAGNTDFILPVPAFNFISGGSQTGNALAMQEFFLMPAGATTFAEAMKMGSETYHHLKKLIQLKYGQDSTNVGDEGSFAPQIKTTEEALELLKRAIEKAGYTGRMLMALDASAQSFCKGGRYDLDMKNPKSDPATWLIAEELFDYYRGFVSKYPLVSIEDAYGHEDWDGWNKITSALNIQFVGDELLLSNPNRIQTAIEKKACNCLLLKINQIGTVTEAIDAFKLSQTAKWGCMVSHRSGETDDIFISHLAVGLGTGQIKAGAPCRGDRVIKYNELLRIEEDLGGNGRYAGRHFRNPKQTRC